MQGGVGRPAVVPQHLVILTESIPMRKSVNENNGERPLFRAQNLLTIRESLLRKILMNVMNVGRSLNKGSNLS
jgi:hypothetical protein